MKRRSKSLWEALGWSGIALLIGSLILTVPRFVKFLEEAGSINQNLFLPATLALLLALAVGGLHLLMASHDPADLPGHRPGFVSVFVLSTVILLGCLLVWATFPTRHLALAVVNDHYRMFPQLTTEIWIGVCMIALGLAITLGAGTILSFKNWKQALTGITAGALAVVLVWTFTPLVTRFLLVEHTLAAVVDESAPVPATVSRVGWTWQPGLPVVGMEKGQRGPVVRHGDGFVALDGTSGEELWTYRLPYARQVETGAFAGTDQYVYLLHVAGPEVDPETQTMIVLDTATGEVVRDGPMPSLSEDGSEEMRYLTPDLRLFHTYEDGQYMVLAHDTESTARIWGFPLKDLSEERLCLRGPNEGISGYGERILVTLLCLDEPQVPAGRPLDVHLLEMDVPDDAVKSVIALDTDTGQQVWRQDWSPQELHAGLPSVYEGGEASGGEPVVVTGGGTFALSDGAPVRSRPETPEENTDRTLLIDSAGTVLVRDQGDEEPFLILRTDAAGEVVQQWVLGREWGPWWSSGSTVVLEEALLQPYTSFDSDDHQIREVKILSLGPEVEETEEVSIDFGGERFPERTQNWSEEPEHHVLAVPGAVVSYLQDTNEPGLDPAPVHGLVP